MKELHDLKRLIIKTRARRKVIVSVGVVAIIALSVLTAIRFVVEQVATIRDYTHVSASAHSHIDELQTMMDESKETLETIAKDSVGSEEYYDLTDLIVSVENTIDQSSSIFARYSTFGSSSAVSELNRYDERLQTLILRLKNSTDNLSLKSSDEEYSKVLSELKEVVTSGTRIYADSASRAKEEDRVALLGLTQSGTDIIRTDTSHDVSDKSALKDQIRKLIDDIKKVSDSVSSQTKEAKQQEADKKAEEEAAKAASASPSPTKMPWE